MGSFRASMRLLLLAALCALGALAPGPLLAHHGPGTTGGAVATQSGETLKPGAFSLGFSWSYTQFESLTGAEIARRTARVKSSEPDFDAIRWSLLQTAELYYGVMEDLQIGASFGFY